MIKSAVVLTVQSDRRIAHSIKRSFFVIYTYKYESGRKEEFNDAVSQ